MKKIFLFSLVIICLIPLSILSCSEESTEDVEIDNSLVAASKLKQLIESKQSLRLSMKNKLASKFEDDRSIEIPPECMSQSVEQATLETEFENKALTINAFDYEMRDLRDDYLLTGTNFTDAGQVYNDAYYYMSSVLKNYEIYITDIGEYLNVIPTVTGIKNRLYDKNFNGIVISNEDKEQLLTFIDNYRSKLNTNGSSGNTNNSLNIQLIDAIKEDIVNLTNRNSTQITNFLSK